MGDRPLLIVHYATDVSPTIYLHWSGYAAPNLIDDPKSLMADRTDDVAYAAARLVGLTHTHAPGNLSPGLWETPDAIRQAVLASSDDPLKAYCHGDAGVVLVNAANFALRAVGGYLTSSSSR